jgi:hypothetical protein
MRIARAFLVCVPVVAALALVQASQAPVDFSGKWTLDAPSPASTPAVPGTPAAAAAPGDMGSGWGSIITIAQDARQLTLEYPIFSRYDLQPPRKVTFPLDGSEGKNTVMLGRGEQVESSKARWDGQALVIVTTYFVSDRAVGAPFTVEVTRRLSLESPTTLVVELTRAGVLAGPPATTRSVYRKS